MSLKFHLLLSWMVALIATWMAPVQSAAAACEHTVFVDYHKPFEQPGANAQDSEVFVSTADGEELAYSYRSTGTGADFAHHEFTGIDACYAKLNVTVNAYIVTSIGSTSLAYSEEFAVYPEYGVGKPEHQDGRATNIAKTYIWFGGEDTDGDNILDCHERNGIDADCDGSVSGGASGSDLLIHQSGLQGYHDVAAAVGLKDIYVEVDWLDCKDSCKVIDTYRGDGGLLERSFEPTDSILQLVEDAFDNGRGYRLHLVKSGPIRPDEMMLTVNALNHPSSPPLTTTYYSYDYPNNSAGTDALRETWKNNIGRDAVVNTEGATDHLKRFVRYNVWTQSIDGQFSGWALGDMFVVRYDPMDPAYADEIDHERVDAGTLMHELGHSLGFHHGGGDAISAKLNYYSVMSYRIILDDPSTTHLDRLLTYNNADTTVDQCHVDETMGLSVDDNYLVSWPCPTMPDTGTGETNVGNDLNCDGSLETDVNVPLTLNTRLCVNSNGLVPLEAEASGDDLKLGGRIVSRDPAVPLTTTDVHVNDVLVPSGNAIFPGIDLVIDTVPASEDWIIGQYIVDGPDGECDSEAVGTDLEITDIDRFGAVKQEGCIVEAWDDWENLRVPLSGNLIRGAAPYVLLDADADTFEAFSSSSTVAIETDLSTDILSLSTDGGLLSAAVEVRNNGPSVGKVTESIITLPGGFDINSCSVGGGPGTCTTSPEGVVTSSLGDLPSDEVRTISISAYASCASGGAKVHVLATVDSQTRDTVRTNNSAQASAMLSDFLSAEDVSRPWVISNSGEAPIPTDDTFASTGSSSIPLGCNYLAFESPTFDTAELGAVGSNLVLDLFVPSGGPAWAYDSMDVFIDVPSGGIWAEAIAHLNMAQQERQNWTEVSIPLSQRHLAVLRGDFPDARIRFVSNVSSCNPTIWLDNIRFGGGEVECREASERSVPVSGGAALHFESLSDWASSAAGSVVSSPVTEGAGAWELANTHWSRMISVGATASSLGYSSNMSSLALDVYIPELPAEYYWLGGMNLYFTIPSHNLYNQWIGYHALQILFDGEYNQLMLEIPQELRVALDANPSDVSVVIEVVSDGNFPGIVLDRGGFVQ